MTHKPSQNSLIAPLLLLILSPIGSVFATDVNELFVKRSLETYFSEAMEKLPYKPGGSISLDYAKPDSDNLNVSGSALFSVLKSAGMKLSAEEGSVPEVGLQFKLSEIEFAYENRNGSMFSRGDVYRVLKVAGSFSLLKNEATIWEDFLVREYREQIELSDRQRLESSFSPLFKAELPPGPVQKLWEPMIVTSIIGGLVYLFFASR
jgi:hypothetical protein